MAGFKKPIYSFLSLIKKKQNNQPKKKKTKPQKFRLLGASWLTVCRKSEMMATVESGKVFMCECLTEIEQIRN